MNEIVEKYFKAFSNKDLTALADLYHDDVVLWEWGTRIFMGKEQVLEANTELFSSAERITVLLQKSASNEDKHFCELIIILDDKILTVMDVITIVDNKITSVQAYRGF